VKVVGATGKPEEVYTLDQRWQCQQSHPGTG